VEGVDVAFEGTAGAEGDDGESVALADAEDGADFFDVRGKANDVGQGGGVVGLAVAMEFADGVSGLGAWA